MIVMLRALICGGLVLALASGAFGQEPVPAPGPSGLAEIAAAAAAARLTDTPVIPRKDLVVRYYRMTEAVSAHALMQAAVAVFGRSFYVDDMDRRAAPARNFFVVGDALAIFETGPRADMILAALPDMERAAAPSSNRTDPYVGEVVRLEHIPAHVASLALRPFYREPRSDVPNFVMTNPAGNTIVLRDRPEAIAEMKAVLARLDVPSKHGPDPTAINLDCHVIRAVKEPVTGQTLPRDLTESLSRLTAWKHFEDLGMVAVRASTGADVEAEAALADGHHASLAFGRLATEGDTLEIGSLIFRLASSEVGALHSLKTSTEVSDGEFTVIGAFGSVPYFLVIQVRF
jgi:hypothetical protein